MKYIYIIEQAPDGGYSAYVPDLPGCTSAGDTLDELHANIGEAVVLWIEAMREKGELVPDPTSRAGLVDAA